LVLKTPVTSAQDRIQINRITTGLLRFALFFSIAALMWALSVLFIYHKFNAFAVCNNDHYGYVGLHTDGCPMTRYLKLYPRPLGYIILDLCGRLGIHWLFAPLFIFAIANAALVATLVERLVDKKIPLFSFVLFSALVLANPWYQIHVKSDPFAIFALTFVLIGFHLWQSLVGPSRPWRISAVVVLIALSCFIKESYFCAVGLFFVIQIISQKGRRKAAALVLVICSAFMLFALYRASQAWLLFHEKASPTDPYYTDLHLAALIHGFTTLSRYLVYPWVSVGIALILVLAWRHDKRLFWIGAAGVVLGLSALLPNSALPNHLQQQYAVLGIELFMSPILLTWFVMENSRERWLVTGAVTLAAAIAILNYSRTSRYEVAWILELESFAARAVASLENIQGKTPADSAFLVTAVDRPSNLFYTDDFIETVTGPDRFFTVIVPDRIPTATHRVTQLVHASDPESVRPESTLLVFEPDGSLEGTLPSAAGQSPADGRTFQPVYAAHAAEFRLWATLPSGCAEQNGQVQIIHWSVPGARIVEIHMESPSGQLFAAGDARGQATTGSWAKPGVKFFLQDATQGDSTLPSRTLATLILK
jgi:drug/metabolite transporter superfamily protein YnfA